MIDEVWAVTECLRCRGVAACVASLPKLSRIQARRLQLAAEHGGGVGIVLRPAGAASWPYAAATRWLVRPATGDRRLQRWSVQLLHGHGGRIGQSVLVEACRETHHVRAVETMADRPDQTKTVAPAPSSLRPPRPDPLVLIRVVASRQVVTAACETARSHGVSPGMTLAEARALCPGLQHGDDRPDKDQRALEAFARWMVRFSPVVAIEPPDVLMLDVTGSERLFHGYDRLCRLVTAALVKLNLGRGDGSEIAIAPTPCAAWAWPRTGMGIRRSFHRNNCRPASVHSRRQPCGWIRSW